MTLQGARRITTTRLEILTRLGSGRCKQRSPLAASQSILISAYWRFKCLCDDSLGLQAQGFWNDTGMQGLSGRAEVKTGVQYRRTYILGKGLLIYVYH